jgi:sporulation protein YabP
MEGREKLTVTGVEDVDSFDEEEVVCSTVRGKLVIRGGELRLEKLSLDTGEIVACGRIDGIEYGGEDTAESAGFLPAVPLRMELPVTVSSLKRRGRWVWGWRRGFITICSGR